MAQGTVFFAVVESLCRLCGRHECRLCLVDEVDFLTTAGKTRTDVLTGGGRGFSGSGRTAGGRGQAPERQDVLMALALAAVHPQSRIIVVGTPGVSPVSSGSNSPLVKSGDHNETNSFSHSSVVFSPRSSCPPCAQLRVQSVPTWDCFTSKACPADSRSASRLLSLS